VDVYLFAASNVDVYVMVGESTPYLDDAMRVVEAAAEEDDGNAPFQVLSVGVVVVVVRGHTVEVHHGGQGDAKHPLGSELEEDLVFGVDAVERSEGAFGMAEEEEAGYIEENVLSLLVAGFLYHHLTL
jgi:alkanesulfonate monooxygenase SsuD/methylene tetrahydromethanopterin reductase-like flavin-dependent oxidoreductase (luciferase family)